MNVKRLRKILDYLCEKDKGDGCRDKYFQKSPDGYYLVEGYQCVVNGNNIVNHNQSAYLTVIDLENKTAKIKGFSYDGHKGDCFKTTETDIEFSNLSDYYFESNFRSIFEKSLKEEEARKAEEKFIKMMDKKIAKFLKE